MNNEQLFLILGGAVLAGGIAWHLMTQTPPAHVVVDIDASSSVERNCAGLRDATRRLLTGKADIRDGSMLGVLVMGSDARNAQPKLGFHKQIPIPSDIVYGRDEEASRKTEDAYFTEVENVCQSAVAGSGSPIYELVRRGLEQLRSETPGCGPNGRCYVLVKTDLDEDVEPSLRKVLERAIKTPSVRLAGELARSLDNAGIEVHFCGTAEVRSRRGPTASPETRQRVWTELFTQPALVSFEPYCR